MPVRVGVDVGGTFTKAVACDDRSGEVIASAAVPTSHKAPLGVSEGVVAAAEEVRAASRSHGETLVIAHSTTQAVNALLEGDTARVGVVGIGVRPDLRRTIKRTRIGHIGIAPGRDLETLHAFIDATDGIEEPAVIEVLAELQERGAEALCVSQAFGVEDPSAERRVVAAARELGLPACAGHELTGLYGLEMRTVTGAVNASILPTALRTASYVEEAFSNGARASLLVMRGDGGAADLSTMSRHPLATAFSGPAASVAGALRRSALHNGIVIEVGGTSTNISPVRGGRPILSYIRVLEHVTCIRSLDARVIGVGGGSLVRAAPKRGVLRIVGVGPRSAHIADLEYCTFARRDLVEGAIRLVSPRSGDPAEYAVLELPDGKRFAITPTCAANALGIVPPGAYASGDRALARQAFDVLGRALGLSWDRAARAVLDQAIGRVFEAVRASSSEHQLETPLVVGVGGGAGAVVPMLAERLGWAWQIPQHAEVISSIGDALSLVRTEVERTLPKSPSPDLMRSLQRAAQDRAVAAGAAPETVQVTSETVPERRAVRAVATGSVALETGALPASAAAGEEEIVLAAKAELRGEPHLVARNDFYSIFSTPVRKGVRWAIVDLRAVPVAAGEGDVLTGPARDLSEAFRSRVEAWTRHLGPLSVAPQVRLVTGAAVTDLGCYTTPDKVIEVAEKLLAETDEVATAVFTRN